MLSLTQQRAEKKHFFNVIRLKSRVTKPTNASVFQATGCRSSRRSRSEADFLEAELVVRSSVFFSICAVTSSTHGLDKPEVQHTQMFLNTSRMRDETHNFGH